MKLNVHSKKLLTLKFKFKKLRKEIIFLKVIIINLALVFCLTSLIILILPLHHVS
jgi:hypothetical protein